MISEKTLSTGPSFRNDCNQFSIRLRPLKIPLLIFFLSLFLLGWLTVGLYTGIRFIFFESSEILYVMLGSFVWAAVTMGVGFPLLWFLIGKEIVTLSRREISIRYDFWGVHITGTYPVHEINFSPTYMSQKLMEDPVKYKGFGRGPLWFEHKGFLVRFGTGLDENQARLMAERIHAKTGLTIHPAQDLQSNLSVTRQAQEMEYTNATKMSQQKVVTPIARELEDIQAGLFRDSIVDGNMDTARETAKERLWRRSRFAVGVFALGIVVLMVGRHLLQNSDFILRIQPWILWALGGLGAFVLLFLTVKLGSKYDEERQKKMLHIARALGLKYDDHGKTEDHFGWEMTGKKGGRKIKINTIGTGTSGNRQSLAVISASARTPDNLSVDIMYGPISFRRPYRLRTLKRNPPSSLQDKGIYAVIQGEFDPEALAGMDIGRILSIKDMRDAAISIKSDSVKLMYDFSLPELNWNVSFMKRVINATCVLAEHVENFL